MPHFPAGTANLSRNLLPYTIACGMPVIPFPPELEVETEPEPVGDRGPVTRRNSLSMELCDECKERNLRGLDPSVEWDDVKERTCSECGSWFEHPYFLLNVLHGQLREPLDPHSFEMTPSVWSNLPSECLDIILARVPLGSRVRFSLVCKAWQSLLASSDFKRLCDSVEPPELPVCNLEYRPGKLVPCKPRAQRASETEEWEHVKVGLSFLPPKFQAFHFQECVAHDGLVCIFKVDRQKTQKPKVGTQGVQMSPSRSHGTRVEDGDGDGDEEEKEGEEQGDRDRNGDGDGNPNRQGDDFEQNVERDEEGYFMAEDEDYDEEGYFMAEDEDYDEEGYFMAEDEEYDVVGMSFCIANPVMRTFKELYQEFDKEDLPQILGKDNKLHDHRACWRVQLEVDASGHFTVMVLCMRKDEPTVTIYRSRDNSWEATALTRPLWFMGRDDDGWDWPKYGLCNGELYTSDLEMDNCMNIHSLKSGLIIWNGEWDGIFHDEEEKTSPDHICNVFAWQGKLFCLEQGFDRSKVDVGVWELERSPYSWRKVSSLPKHLQEMLMKPMTVETLEWMGRLEMITRQVTLDGASVLGDTLYFSIETGFDLVRGRGDLVAYNILDNTWSFICEDVATSYFWIEGSYLFRPNDFVV